jgi:hypothetical protein
MKDDPAHKANHWAALRQTEREGREPPGTADRLMAEAAAREAAERNRKSHSKEKHK